MKRVTAALLFAAAIAEFGLAAATSAMAQPRASTDLRAQRRATAESIAAQYAAEQFRANRIGDEGTRKLLIENEAQRRKISAVLKDAKATAAERDAARAQLQALDAQLTEVNKKLLASEQTGEELRAQLREYTRQITDAVEAASPEVAAAYELYAQGDRDTAYEVIDRLSQVEAAAAKRAGEIRAGALLRRPATLAFDRRDRGEMTLAQVIVAWERAQAGDPTYHVGWMHLATLLIDAGRLADAKTAVQQGLTAASNDTQRGRANALLGEVLLSSGDPRAAETAFDTSLKQLKDAFAADPDDKDAAEGIMAALDRIGDMRSANLDYVGASEAYEEELALGRRMAAARPDSLRAQRDLMICLSKVGDSNLQTRKFPAAKAAYDEMLAITRRVLATAPDNVSYQREHATALLKLGEFHTQALQSQLARPYIDEGIGILRRLLAADPTDTSTRSDLSFALEYQGRLTDIRTAAGLRTFRTLLDEALQMRRDVAAVDPTNVQRQRDLANGLHYFGEQHFEHARQTNAPAELVRSRRAFEESLAIYRRIAAAETANGLDHRRVGVVLGEVAKVVEASGDVPAAKALWDEMLTLRRLLAKMNERSALAHKDLGVGLIDVANLPRNDKDWQGRLALYEEAATALEVANRIDAGDAEAKHGLGVAHKLAGDMAYLLDKFDATKTHYQGAIDAFYQLRTASPNDATAHRNFWACLYTWALMVDHPVAWGNVVTEMEAANAKGFLSASDKTLLTEARAHAKRSAEEAAAKPAAPAAPAPTPGASL